MKTILFIKLILISSLFTFCKAQTNQKNIEKFDFADYIDMKFDKQFPTNIYFVKGDKKIQIQYNDNNITIIETNTKNRYGVVKSFSTKTNLITTEGVIFDEINIGILKKYDENGKISELDLDKDYPFTIENLKLKLKEDFKIDLDDRNVRINRIHRNLGNPFCYGVYIPNKEMNGIRILTFSAINGNLIKDEFNHFEK
jgi:hypothetical protein